MPTRALAALRWERRLARDDSVFKSAQSLRSWHGKHLPLHSKKRRLRIQSVGEGGFLKSNRHSRSAKQACIILPHE